MGYLQSPFAVGVLLLKSAVLANVDIGIFGAFRKVMGVVNVVAADFAGIFVLGFVCCRGPDDFLTRNALPIAPFGMAAALRIAAVFTFADSVVRCTGCKVLPVFKIMVARYGFVADNAGFPMAVLVFLVSLRINVGMGTAVRSVPMVFPILSAEHAGRVLAGAARGFFQFFAAIKAKTAFIADIAFAFIETFFAIFANYAMLDAMVVSGFAASEFLIAVFTFGAMQFIGNGAFDAGSAVFAPVRFGANKAPAASAGAKEFIHTAVAMVAVRMVIAVVKQAYLFTFHADIVGIVTFKAHFAGTAPIGGTVLANLAHGAKIFVAANFKTFPAMVAVLRRADHMSFTVSAPIKTVAAESAVRALGVILEAIFADAVLSLLNSAINAHTAIHTFVHAVPADFTFRAEQAFINITAVTGRIALTAICAGELITFR